MTTTALTPPSPREVLPRWLNELQAADRATGTIRRYKSAVESFLTWYKRCEQRPLTFATLTPIALVGYRNELQRTQGRATSTVNGHLSALRAWCAWLTEERYLEVNPARRIKLVGRLSTSAMRQMIDVLVRDASARGLVPAQTSAHTLRHTFARNYLAQYPGDVVGLATLLGHSSLDTTRIYSQPTVAQLSTRVEQLRQNAYGEA